MTDIPPPSMPTAVAIMRARVAASLARGPAWEGYGIAASALGQECDRRLWYGLRWASIAETPESADALTDDQILAEGRKLRIFERGMWAETRLIRDLRSSGVVVQDVDPMTRKQWTFSMARGFIRGKADGKCFGVKEAPKAEHVLEVKSLKASDFRAIMRHGLLAAKPEHWHQLHAGIAGLGLSRGFYIAENKDTEEILTERVKFDAEIAARQCARVENIVDADAAPQKIATSATNRACTFCNHVALCHGDAFARRTCRTCLHFSFTADGNGKCARFGAVLDPATQKAGCECPAHLFLPSLVPGEQIDASDTGETVTYKLRSGEVWTDGA